MMSARSVSVITLASMLLVVAESPAVSAHGSPPEKWFAANTLAAMLPAATESAPAARCEKCEDLAEKLKQAQERHRNVSRIISETADRLAKMRAEQATAQARLEDLQRNAPLGGERTRMMADLERRLSNIQSNIKQLSDSLEKSETQENSLSYDIVVLSVELAACNKRCNRTSPPTDPPGGAGVRPGQSVTPVAKCPECQSADRLKELQDQRRDLAERLDGYRAEADKVDAGLKNSDPRGALPLFGLGVRLATITVELENELHKLDDEIVRAAAELKACNDRCKTTETGSATSPSGSRVSGTARIAGARTTRLDAANNLCAEIMAAGSERGFMTTCTGDDSGPGVAFGADVRYNFNRDVDVAVMARALKPADGTVNATQSIGNTQLTSGFMTSGFIFAITPVLAYSPTKTVRVYGGWGVQRLNQTVTGDHRATFNGRTETESDEEQRSASGTHFRVGAEFHITPRFGVYGEGARFYFSSEFGRLSQLAGGMFYLLGARRY
jgi:hypothetical protein